MQITFKNVGQGDSIILEWSRNNEPRLGIVDCHIFQNTNPTVRHLQKVGCRKIDFIILSHPHDDHFSGMLELLEFCEKQDIPILRFMHSAAIHPEYLNFANINSSDQELLQKIFQKVKALYEKKLIRNAGYISQDLCGVNVGRGIGVNVGRCCCISLFVTGKGELTIIPITNANPIATNGDPIRLNFIAT